MRIFVTGANGFIGRHLSSYLVERGHEVTAVVRKVGSAPEGVHEVVVPDLLPESNWAGLLTNQDAVIHLAARVHVMSDKTDDPLTEYRRVNVHGTEALVTASIAQGVERFVFLSSVKVYGEETSNAPYVIFSETRPVDPYGVSKLEAENSLREAVIGTGMSFVIVRTPLVYGPRVGGNFKRIMKLADSGLPLPLVAVRNRRAMVSVWNLVHLLESAAIDSEAADATVLAGDGASTSTAHLVRTLRKAMGRPARLFWVPVGLLRLLGALVGQSSAVSRLVDSLEVEVGSDKSGWTWKPQTSFASGIERTVNWFMSQKKLSAAGKPKR